MKAGLLWHSVFFPPSSFLFHSVWIWISCFLYLDRRRQIVYINCKITCTLLLMCRVKGHYIVQLHSSFHLEKNLTQLSAARLIFCFCVPWAGFHWFYLITASHSYEQPTWSTAQKKEHALVQNPGQPFGDRLRALQGQGGHSAANR